MPSKRVSGFSSAFDDMLERNRRELDTLSGGGDLGRSPAGDGSQSVSTTPRPSDRAEAYSPPARTPAERALDEKLGPRWRYDVMERIRENGELVVRCRVTVPGRGVTRTQYGTAAGGDGSIHAERQAEGEAVQSALAACAQLF